MKLARVIDNEQFFLDHCFDSFFRQVGTFSCSQDVSCDLSEDDKCFYLEMNTPGFKKEDISIECDKQEIKISAKKNNSEEEKKPKRTYHILERQSKSFSRKISLSRDVNVEEIEAKYDFGILKIKIPKIEKVRAKVINIS